MPSAPSVSESSCAAELPAALKHGACGLEVEYLQRQLEEAGFSPGAVDGVFGAKTKAAVMAFQRARGLEVDGVASPRTWAALDTRRGSGLRPILKRGGGEPAVVVLQKVLATHGFDPGSKDGEFGPKTERAVLAFQRAKGLEADGVVGPKTWNALGMTAPRSFPAVTGPMKGIPPAALAVGARPYPV
ncbi:peptidoglycan-binding domain-containing protein [Hyalangium versicolor]|uniref:peptidoglycan-binding domain-containing protein n=1 Tax=Hyalangium versicolor TaxID=2861190 RepID=UPI001CCB00D2|nr:peptidoglycan-binding protein [Hyalangium versicolor]